VQLIQRQSDEIEAHVIANLVHNDPNRFEELVERGIGSFAQNQVYQQIYS